MSDLFRRASVGDPIDGIPAEMYNLWIEAAKDFKRRQSSQRAGGVTVPSKVTLNVQNASGGILEQFAVARLGDPLVHPSGQAKSFFGDTVFETAGPISGRAFGIMQEPTRPGVFAPTIFKGMTYTFVRLHDPSHRYADCATFESFIEWLKTPPPPGCGLGSTPDAITLEELFNMCEKVAPDVARILAQELKRGKRGGDKKSEQAKNQSHARGIDYDRQGMQRQTLSIRLAQEHPEVYQAFLNGEHNSVRAAAEAAGIVKPGHDPLMRCKAYWRKLSKAERKVFAKWIEEQ